MADDRSLEATPSPAAPARAQKRWGARVAIGVAATVLMYLALTFVWPATVPRLAFLPKPEPTGGGYDGCNWYGDDWESDGLVWVQVRYSTARGCDLD